MVKTIVLQKPFAGEIDLSKYDDVDIESYWNDEKECEWRYIKCFRDEKLKLIISCPF